MFNQFFIIVVGLLFSVSLCVLIFAVRNIGHTIPKDDRRYKDPLPFKMKLIWPLANFFAHYIGRFLSIEYIEQSKRKLQRAELIYLMEPEQLFGLQITSALIASVLAGVALNMIDMFTWMYVMMAAILGFFLPLISANDRRKKREKQLIRSLPVYLDFITMAIEAGMNLSGAMQQAVEKGPPGPMGVEFNTVLRDVRAGMSRIDALRLMATRLNLKEINSLVAALAQAESTGASLSETLRIQSSQRRVERFQKAEKMAMEAPVKLTFPLVAFIFPCTFVVLFFPIVLKFIMET
ncbi:type II secretion system F family protein [Arenicella xantha]|uniref:Tight adherence protein C n=1 Tax=Arenicella xantha TaxID=644221 RepID=A0A395JNJ4_9GAMM|nr:type II secretion system F family protein [Arenicella xantha]RBP51377.1 tight adherence protein C [Arenicella xantha]